jgi:hypothetical protein
MYYSLRYQFNQSLNSTTQAVGNQQPGVNRRQKVENKCIIRAQLYFLSRVTSLKKDITGKRSFWDLHAGKSLKQKKIHGISNWSTAAVI